MGSLAITTQTCISQSFVITYNHENGDENTSLTVI